MIESIEGAGLSGIAGKSGKQGKNSLFAKLLAMLEKHAEANGKGKSPGMGSPVLGKGKVVSVVGQSEALAATKGKQLLTMVSKDKSMQLKTDEESATPLFTSNVIIDAALQVKKAREAAKAGVVLPEQKSEAKTAADASVLKQPLLTEHKSHAPRLIDADQDGEFNLKAEAKQLVSGKTPAGHEQSPLPETEASQSRAVDRITASISAQKNQHSGSAAMSTLMAENSGEQKAAVQSGQASEQKAAVQSGTTPLAGSALGEKSESQPRAEASQLLAGAQQQSKPAAGQQIQNSAATPVATTVTQAGSSDASLSDSGSDSSDRGSQDARQLASVSGEAKSSGTSASSGTNFQSHLNGKNAAGMTVFDTMNHIAQSAKNGQTRLEIQLEPANLGKIQISLQTDAAKQLQVHMIVDQGATRAVIEQQLPQLRTALAQQGFDLSGFSMDSQGQQASSGGNGHGHNSRMLADHAETATAENTSTMQPVQHAAAGSGVSIRV